MSAADDANPLTVASALEGGRERTFLTTRWQVVMAATEDTSPAGQEALAQLCNCYWPPVYAFIRRKGYEAPDAQDLTQEFFYRLLDRHYLRSVDMSKGRFRSFLITALDRFLSKEWKRAHRLKRGGANRTISLDAAQAEERYALEPAHTLTAERIYDRRWAMTLLERTLDRLRDECEGRGKRELFERAKPLLAGEDSERSFAELARELGMTAGAFKVAMHRLRVRYAELLREEVAQTVATPAEIDEEIRYLLSALAAE